MVKDNYNQPYLQNGHCLNLFRQLPPTVVMPDLIGHLHFSPSALKPGAISFYFALSSFLTLIGQETHNLHQK